MCFCLNILKYKVNLGSKQTNLVSFSVYFLLSGHLGINPLKKHNGLLTRRRVLFLETRNGCTVIASSRSWSL
jgi:hypothetical protein